ncbi:3-hydroxyacyl-CoA dehydrogenase NAD-binding domain-containing protein [Nocardioides convexus]|uniref:3-hydroxyacyl-CoA dehydrogenase NAD-binding domain-containing protein n=1 Tax=Nocardioides convexus TaxID=2712224 RepID=UPI002418178E|nr:3-hydroxyacyl-CoA dehydrogenase NAD-binding domain-containing protein [Nocardioides convexus]
MSETSLLTGPVEIVGTGLIGTSIALACRRAGLDVLLTDSAPDHLRTASGLGAGRARTPEDVPQAGRRRRAAGRPRRRHPGRPRRRRPRHRGDRRGQRQGACRCRP